ncbi:hypothetical protein [Streptomyces sp. NPDC058401]|uniref:hypothetical protein n=1 Tax=Streptomyces sp. NPDC058401 TaxID=3346480 RepID=UPI0036690C9A
MLERPDTDEEKPVWVLVRVGVDRYRYHTDLQCPALQGKHDTGRHLELMTEVTAQGQKLTQCGRCRRHA